MLFKCVSLIGLCAMLGIAWACSSNRKAFPVRLVVWGLSLQFLFALIILKTPVGDWAFKIANQLTAKFLEVANKGAGIVFNPLVTDSLMENAFGPGNTVIFAIRITATIIVVSSVSALLYHWGILQKIVQAMAWLMERSMKTSGSESLAAAANIFMGQTEAPLMVKPYLKSMTRSELMAMMTGGMATIAGSVLTVYVSLGVNAGHLLTASIMSAPGALVIAKIMWPETETSETAAGARASVEKTSTNAIDALCHGAGDGMKLSINVIAMLIAFVAFVALVNFLLVFCQRPLGTEVTLQQILGWLNTPIAWLMGVPARDCGLIGQVLGERIILNEFIGYLSLSEAVDKLDPRSYTLATYALCGFANFGSIAIQIGGIGSLVPSRRADLAKLGARAMLAGVLACYLTATIVGILL